MKNLSLLFAMAAGASIMSGNAAPPAVCNADQPSMVWGWCEEPDVASPFPSGWYCNSAIGFSETLTQKFAGCYVTSILICKGYYAEEPMIDLFLAKGSEEPNEWGGVTLYTDEPFVSIKNVPFAGEQWEWVEFELPEPYQIVEGEPFYVGWGFLNTNDENAPLVADNIPNDNLASSWMEGYEPQDPYYGYWNNCTTAGANCIRLRIAGETLPSDDAVITGIEVPRRIYPDKAFDVSITVSNAASSEIKELEIQYCFPEGEKQKEIVSGLSIPAGEKDKVELKNIKTTNWGNIQLDIEILSVNGKKDADYSNNMISAYILNLPEDMGFDRKILVEEGTGTWCGNCPRGIVGMRQMAEKYPEKFIGVAAHYSDRMQIEAYQPYLNRYIDIVGYPYSTIDRVISCDPEFNELEENFLREMEIPSLAEISIEDMSIIGEMAYVNPTVKFAISEDNTEYGWAYVVTEDNVGPYNQTNYYTDGSLSGWDFSENPVNIYYDEVAVGAAHILGKNALPASIEAEKTYSLPMTFDVPGVQNWDNAHLIVMVLNMKTGYIENAVRKSFAQNSIKGIDEDDNFRVNLSGGEITLVSGDLADVYNLHGVKIGTLNNGEHLSVGYGVYLLKTSKKAYKVVVK